MVMLAPWSRQVLFFILFVLLQTGRCLFAQPSTYPVSEWAKKLSARNATPFSGVAEIYSTMANEDSVHVVQHFKLLERKGDASNLYFICRFNVAKATYLRNHGADRKLVKDLMTRAITAAYETDNDSL